MADNKSSEVYERLDSDLEFYFKYEMSLSDEVKLAKLRDIKERIRGLTYVFGMEDKKLNSIRERIHQLEMPIIERLNQYEEKKNSKSVGSFYVDIDCSDALKGLKAVQREARKATAALKELEEQKKNKYLSIELDELGDVPKVFYKGKEVTNKESINFQWTTRTDIPGRTEIILDYFEKNEKGRLVRRSIRKGV